VVASGHPVDTKNVKVQLRFANGTTYDQMGAINFIDVNVDRTTDTVLVRATFPNPAGGLIDGQLVRVDLESGAPEEKVVVPQAALIADQQGVYVFIVEGAKAAVRRLKLGGESGTDVVVEEGLSGGELIIAQGIQNVRPGIPVRANPLPQTAGRSLSYALLDFCRPAAACHRNRRRDHDRRSARALCNSHCAVSRDRPAPGLRHHQLSRGLPSSSPS
jgi:hypothetical protein